MCVVCGHRKMVLTDIYSITGEVTFVFCCRHCSCRPVHNELLPCVLLQTGGMWLLFRTSWCSSVLQRPLSTVTIRFVDGNLRFTRMPNAMATANGNWERLSLLFGDNGFQDATVFPVLVLLFLGGAAGKKMQSMANSVECCEEP